VDYLDEAGVFQGGAILPGYAMMADYLAGHTEALPLLKPGELAGKTPFIPGKSTTLAMHLGMAACLEGGVEYLIKAYRNLTPGRLIVFVGGGDAQNLPANYADLETHHWPEMTLEGIRLAAERL
jgi:pantothenate kinase type III